MNEIGKAFSELAQSKIKPTFDEINKKFSPTELIKNSEQNGISGSQSEIEDIEKEVEEKSIIQNKEDGLRREKEVLGELQEQYPEEEGYQIESEVYLRDENGNIVKDPITGEARRIDFVVVKDGEVIESIEVTSKTADKTEQSAKETRIRENGGNYIKDTKGNPINIPDTVQTKIERRD